MIDLLTFIDPGRAAPALSKNRGNSEGTRVEAASKSGAKSPEGDTAPMSGDAEKDEFDSVFAGQEDSASAESDNAVEPAPAWRRTVISSEFLVEGDRPNGPPLWKLVDGNEFNMGDYPIQPLQIQADAPKADIKTPAAPANAPEPSRTIDFKFGADPKPEGVFFEKSATLAEALQRQTASIPLPEETVPAVELKPVPVVEEKGDWRREISQLADLKVKPDAKLSPALKIDIGKAPELQSVIAQPAAENALGQTTVKPTVDVAQPIIANNAPTVHQAAHAAAQIGAAIRANGPSANIEIRLDPPELGKVRIEFSMDTPDAVKAVLSAERTDTLDHLRRNISQLHDQLKSAGFSDVNLEFSQYQSSTQNDSAFSSEGVEFQNEQEGGAAAITYLKLRDPGRLDLLV